MIHSLQIATSHYRKWSKGVFMFALPQLLLVIAVLALIVIAFAVSFKSTRGPLSLTALKNYLGKLQLKFLEPSSINPEAEREELEKLLNNVKSSCHEQVISGNTDLKAMFGETCQQIKSVTGNKEISARSSWQKLKDVTCGFDELYFPKTI